jgi:hypothetical protein
MSLEVTALREELLLAISRLTSEIDRIETAIDDAYQQHHCAHHGHDETKCFACTLYNEINSP